MVRIFAVLMACVAFAASALADVVKLKDGRAIEGKILEDTPEKLVLEIQHGGTKAKMTILKENIVSIEKAKSKEEEYAEKRAEVKDEDFPAQLELATWCMGKGMTVEASRHFLLIVNNSPKGPEASEAKKSLQRLGWREFPKVGWMKEDDYFAPKGFVRGKAGKWVTKEYSVAEAEYEKAKKALDEIRHRGDYQDRVLGDQKDAYNALVAEYNRINDRRNSLIEDWKTLRGKALDALNNLSTTTITEGDWDGLYQDGKGNLVTAKGTIVATSTTFNVGAWTAFQGCIRGMKSDDKEIKACDPKLKKLSGEIEAMMAKAKSQAHKADQSDKDEDRAKENVAEAEKRMDQAREDMKDKLGPDGLPKE